MPRIRPLIFFGSMAATLLVLNPWPPTSEAQRAGEAPQEVFRSGVDLVQLDVTVLDADGRPIRDLTAGDFTILEDGNPQSIVTFLPVDVPPAVLPQGTPPRATWWHEIPEDIVSNTQDTWRLVVIVMDDARTGYEHGESGSARAIARAAIDALGPNDLAAVVFTLSGQAQTFTTDRARLLGAVDSFRPKHSSYAGSPLACRLRSCVITTLTTVTATLRTAAPARKLVIFISSAGAPIIDVDGFTQMTPVMEMFRTMQEANITVNAFDPAGLRSYGPFASDRFPGEAQARIGSLRRSADELRALAENTGGRTFVDDNKPERHVPAVFEQSGSYYLLGFQSTNGNHDGRFRRVRVRVNRQGATVRTRSGYFAPRRQDAGRSPEPPRSLEATLESGIPVKDVPLRMQIATFPVPGTREVAVTVTAGLTSTAAHDTPAATMPFELVTAAFDRDLRPRGRVQQTVRLPLSPGSNDVYDVPTRLPLRPGRYEIRLAVEHGGRRGSVFANVDVPDFAKEDLALSDLVLARRGPPAPDGPLADLLPVEPTTARDFDASDRVTAFLRIYQRAKAREAPVAITTRILSETQEVVFRRTDEYTAEAVASDRAIDHQVEVPLSGLPAGPYLLVVEAPHGHGSIRRTARFTISRSAELQLRDSTVGADS